MKAIEIKSFAKINLALNVDGYVDETFHRVDMIMAQLDLFDRVKLRFSEDDKGSLDIRLTTNKPYLPKDSRNLAYKAALLLVEKGVLRNRGRLDIDIEKRIPVAAGMAGGSGNGAAVLHGLNALLNLGLSLDELMDLGGELGSDVPFSIMGQAAANTNLPDEIRSHKMAVSCARATGRGTELHPLRAPYMNIVVAKPHISVSTKEVYQNIDRCKIEVRPDVDFIVKSIKGNKWNRIYDKMANVLEAYTLEEYPKVKKLKDIMLRGIDIEDRNIRPLAVLMSGSGPTVFGVYRHGREVRIACEALRSMGYEAYWTKTTK